MTRPDPDPAPDPDPDPDSGIGSDDPHQVLGVSRSATPDEVRQAYRRLLRQHRPEQDAQGFQQLRAAYDLLQEGGYAYQGFDWDEADRQDADQNEADEADEDEDDDEDDDEADDGADEEDEDEDDDEEWVAWDGPTVVGRAELRRQLQELDRLGELERIPAVMRRSLGELPLRDPDFAASIVLDLLRDGSGSFSPLAYALFIAWLESIGCRAEWFLDQIERASVDSRFAKEVGRALGRPGFPDAFVRLLRDHEELYGDELCDACTAVFDAGQVVSTEPYRWARALRLDYPLLWASWRRLRGRLLDLTEGERQHQGAVLSARDCRRIAWDFLQLIDRPLRRQFERPLGFGLVGSIVLAVVLHRWLSAGVFVLLLVVVTGMFIASNRYAKRWAFYRYLLPLLRRSLPEKGLCAADIYGVLVERPNDFKNWNEVEAEFRQSIPLWLWSASVLRSAGSDDADDADDAT